MQYCIIVKGFDVEQAVIKIKNYEKIELRQKAACNKILLLLFFPTISQVWSVAWAIVAWIFMPGQNVQLEEPCSTSREKWFFRRSLFSITPPGPPEMSELLWHESASSLINWNSTWNFRSLPPHMRGDGRVLYDWPPINPHTDNNLSALSLNAAESIDGTELAISNFTAYSIFFFEWSTYQCI